MIPGLPSIDPGMDARVRRAQEKARAAKAAAEAADGPRALDIAPNPKYMRPRREPRPHFPHLIRPRPVRPEPTTDGA